MSHKAQQTALAACAASPLAACAASPLAACAASPLAACAASPLAACELEGTQHKNFVHHRKKYTIFVQKTPLLQGGHHAIVISDGANDAITFELTVMSGKASAVIAGGPTIAKVVIFQGNMSKLENYGEVTCTLYELTKTAANVLNSDRQYNWLSNNCQHFCIRFLEAHGLRTYTTDTRKVVTGAAVGVAAGAATITLCTIQ